MKEVILPVMNTILHLVRFIAGIPSLDWLCGVDGEHLMDWLYGVDGEHLMSDKS